MKYTQELKVTVYEAEEFTRMVNEPDANNGRDETVFDREVTFPNGYRVAVQVVASTEPDKESCWTQGVLFDQQGHELGCTDVGDSFLGEYLIPDDDAGDEYEVVVVTDMRDQYEDGECPDCGEPINKLCVNGDACSNCEHVFWHPDSADGWVFVDDETNEEVGFALPDEYRNADEAVQGFLREYAGDISVYYRKKRVRYSCAAEDRPEDF